MNFPINRRRAISVFSRRLPLSPDGRPKLLTSPKIAGITIKVSGVDEIMPPIMGTAMRCMISDPVPVLHMIGSKPAMMAS